MQAAGPMQVEKVLDDLIQRLSKIETNPQIRAALIEARRLRNVTMRWAAIPPPPDARREMLSRVMDLVAKAGPAAAGSLRPAVAAEAPDRAFKPPSDRASRPTEPRPAAHGSEPPPRTEPSAGSAPPSPRGDAKVTKNKGSMRPTAPPPPGHDSAPDISPAERYKRKVDTLNYGNELPRAGLRHPGGTPRPSPKLGFELDDFGALPPPPSAKPRFPRTHTIAGIPEANESKATAPHGAIARSVDPPPPPPKRKISSAALDVQKLTSATPAARTSPPPPPDKATPQSVRAPSPSPSGPPSAPPPLRKDKRGTLMMGTIDAGEAIEVALAEAAAESPAIASALAATKAEGVIVTPPSNRPRIGGVEGFSSNVSSAGVAALRPHKPPSNPTMQMGVSSAPPAAPAPRSQAPSSDKPLRTLVAPGVTIVRPDASQWQPHPFAAGVTMKLLYRDPRSGVYTAIVRLAPGAQLPRRRHAAPEEALLVSGIANVGKHEMRPGEYCRAESDTIHEVITTSSGCTFFLCGSEHDEFLVDE